MCKTKMATNASDPIPTRPTTHRTRLNPPTDSPHTHTTSYPAPSTSAGNAPPTTSTSSLTMPSSSHGNTSTSSLSSLRESISEKPHIYSFSEIRSATNNFLLKKHPSSSTNCWRCVLRGRDVIIFQRKFRRKLETESLRERLSMICRSNHSSIIKLLGASVSDEYIYLVYEYTNGANLSDCLRNLRNSVFTVLSSWMSRMQIATDLAHGFDYIHNNTGLNLNLVHNLIKSSSIIVTEPSFNAKICHFGTAQLCGKTDDDDRRNSKNLNDESEITEEVETASFFTRSSSGRMQFEGVRGYMSPEFRATGIPTQKSDVYAFGVVLLELLSGEEPLTYEYHKTRREYTRTSVIDTARFAMDGGEGRLRMWMDRKLEDSFPLDIAESVTRVALECVDVDPDKRPDMGRVSRKISKLFLASHKWSESVKMPTDISVSFAPRP